MRPAPITVTFLITGAPAGDCDPDAELELTSEPTICRAVAARRALKAILFRADVEVEIRFSRRDAELPDPEFPMHSSHMDPISMEAY
jgi:hypothetical protein